jgi:hypothetical protein
MAVRLAERQSKSSAFVAPATAAASLWRRATASRRTARRSLAACPRSRVTFCRRASTWPCARSWGAIQGGATRQWTVASCRFCSLFFTLHFFYVIKKTTAEANVGSSPKDSNPRPFAPLGSAPAPRAPRVLPPLPPAPHACSTRHAALRVCCWDWRCEKSPFRAGGPLDGGTPCGTPEQVKRFRGPCYGCCKPLAPCYCVSADGEAIFGCVPTKPSYFLPACLHMALCPQLGCDPRGGDETIDYCILPFLCTLFATSFFLCQQESGDLDDSQGHSQHFW